MARKATTISIDRAKWLAILFLGIALIVALAQSLRADDLNIKATIKPESLTVGDRFLYTNTITLPPGMTIEPIPIEGKLGEAIVLSPIRKLDKAPSGTAAYACTLAVYQTGKINLPTFSFHQTGSTDTSVMAGDSVAVNIRTILPPDTTGLQIADIRGPKRLRGPIWPYLVALLAIVLIILAIIFIRRWMRGKVVQPVIPPIPAWELAYQKLDALKAERYTEFGKFKQFYFELSLIVREYIEARFENPAAESTTYELEQSGVLNYLPVELYGRLFDCFHRADLVKFAKSIPNAKDAETDLALAYEFVEFTKPIPIIAPETTPSAEVKG